MESQRAECDDLAKRIEDACRIRGLFICSAESLTGGLLADAFVRIPGASDVFLGSAVTYAIAAKAHILGVDSALLEREGAVHPDVAKQMAVGAVAVRSPRIRCQLRDAVASSACRPPVWPARGRTGTNPLAWSMWVSRCQGPMAWMHRRRSFILAARVNKCDVAWCSMCWSRLPGAWGCEA